MKKLIPIIICFFHVISCLGQNIEGKWFFKSILSDSLISSENLKPISQGDYMLLDTNAKFTYHLSELGLLANGKWYLDQNKLIFDYENPYDTRFKNNPFYSSFY